ncbi:disintegrin and metalloproteinase domain-containing protein 12-like [Actinia tenebrosa]|uniref:Disintegrin and metalloproteinase domain-containing protein 12-like n=1 Tax=Actinia tenebrosa TaxID=6105 RepID=A0A6P8H0X6_ACTTE|nr:disintegrin and metalloproteinase domain-containing protein 12-like [Actinia tenebrosa]
MFKVSLLPLQYYYTSQSYFSLGDHEASASFNVNNWVLDTKRNNELAPKTVTVRRFLADNSEVLHAVSPDNCHYQGSIHGVPDSTVVLNTCNGLRGIIDDGKDTFHIEPHDNQKYQGYQNDTKTVIDKVLTLCNAVDAIYQRINVRIVITAIEIWTNGDRIERRTSGGAELGTFQAYRQKELIGKIPHDNGQFLSNHGWGRVIGMAYVGTMCKRLSSAINKWSFGSVIGPYVTLAHEMGHNFGYGHDSEYCKCLTPKGCFMGGHKTRVPGFSNCSLESMKRINDQCLYNKPMVLRPQCGNGIQEGDEECDCGTPEMCKIKDPCCQPHACKLKPSAVCSDLHHFCCKDCQYKRQGTLCRPAETDCDVPEYCPGNARDCPANNYIQNGTPCN